MYVYIMFFNYDNDETIISFLNKNWKHAIIYIYIRIVKINHKLVYLITKINKCFSFYHSTVFNLKLLTLVNGATVFGHIYKKTITNELL